MQRTMPMSKICVDFDCVAVGDFNIHTNNAQDRMINELCCVLDHFGLTQDVKEKKRITKDTV